MNAKHKKYIEQNIELIENDDWEKFFKKAPQGIGEALYIAKIDFMTVLGYIPSYAFAFCSNLTSINIPNSVTSIGSNAFFGCDSLTSVTIPNSVAIIGTDAFCHCSSLTSITIPDSVTSISSFVFMGCSSLTSINFQGTKAQWNKITLGSSWNYGSSITQVICTDGIIDVI